MRQPLLAVLACSLALTGCKKPQAARDQAPAPIAAPEPRPAPEPPPGEGMQTLGGRLAYEAANRPSGTARVEDVLAALDKVGSPVTETRQFLATTAAAAYCAGGRTADGLAIAICEYPSPAAALAGRARVEQQFAAVTGRKIVVTGATTLTTTAPDGGQLEATRARVEQAFAATMR